MNADTILGTFARGVGDPRDCEELELWHPRSDDPIYVYFRGGRIVDGCLEGGDVIGARIMGDLFLQPDSLRVMLGPDWPAFDEKIDAAAEAVVRGCMEAEAESAAEWAIEAGDHAYHLAREG